MNKLAKRIGWWLWRNEWVPLGPLAPYVLGMALGSMPNIRLKQEAKVRREDEEESH